MSTTSNCKILICTDSLRDFQSLKMHIFSEKAILNIISEDIYRNLNIADF